MVGAIELRFELENALLDLDRDVEGRIEIAGQSRDRRGFAFVHDRRRGRRSLRDTAAAAGEHQYAGRNPALEAAVDICGRNASDGA